MTKQPLRDGEYRKDGLVYCAHCHTPRQREYLNRVTANRSVGLSEPTLWQFTFAGDNGYNPEIRAAKKYIAHWEETERESSGLYLWGGVGTGKPYLADCIPKAQLQRVKNCWNKRICQKQCLSLEDYLRWRLGHCSSI